MRRATLRQEVGQNGRPVPWGCPALRMRVRYFWERGKGDYGNKWDRMEAGEKYLWGREGGLLQNSSEPPAWDGAPITWTERRPPSEQVYLIMSPGCRAIKLGALVLAAVPQQPSGGFTSQAAGLQGEECWSGCSKHLVGLTLILLTVN